MLNLLEMLFVTVIFFRSANITRGLFTIDVQQSQKSTYEVRRRMDKERSSVAYSGQVRWCDRPPPSLLSDREFLVNFCTVFVCKLYFAIEL